MKTKHAALGLAAIVALFNLPRCAAGMSDAAVEQSVRSAANQERSDLKALARQQQKDSEAAIEMLQAGCYPVTDLATSVPAPLTVGGAIIHRETGRPLDPGAFVCTSIGEVGLVGDGSRVVRVVKVAPEDMARYQQIFQAIATADFNNVVPQE